MMKTNVGSTDKIVRVMLGVIIGYISFTSPETAPWLRTLLYVVAAILFLTTFVGFCPLYTILNKNTCDLK